MQRHCNDGQLQQHLRHSNNSPRSWSPQSFNKSVAKGRFALSFRRSDIGFVLIHNVFASLLSLFDQPKSYLGSFFVFFEVVLYFLADTSDDVP